MGNGVYFCIEQIVNELALKVKVILETTADENKVTVEVISRGKCKRERERSDW